MGGLVRLPATAVLFILLCSSVPVLANEHPATSNCNLPCMIQADKPIDIKLQGCDRGALSITTYSGRALNQAGASCPGADFWTVAVGDNVYENSDFASLLRTSRTPDGQSMIQSFHFTKFGEDVVLQANYTLVRNGTIIRYGVHNHGSAPVDIGFKYSWDLALDNEQNPAVFVENRAGDGKGAKGTYADGEVSLGPTSNDIPYVKVWQTRNGPDGQTDVKQYFWWAEAWGGTAPDLVQYMDSGNALGQQNSFTYQISSNTITESEFQTYFGKPELIHLDPDDGAEGAGSDEREFIIWMGTGIPDPLITYRMAANFPTRGPDADFATAFVEAGGKATYLVRVASLTGLNNGKSLDMRYHVEAVPQALPKGWTVQMLDDQTGQPASDVVLGTNEEHYYRLVVQAPKDAYGKDAARVIVRASLADPPAGLYNKKTSVFEVPLTTTTIVKAQYGIGLKAPDDVLPVQAGDVLEFPLQVTNIGNLRDPFNVEMLFAAGGTTFTKEMSPQVFSLARGQTQEVTVRLTVPADAFGGEQTLVLQALEPDSLQSNKTAVRVRVVSDSDILIRAEQDNLLLPPGAQGTFKALVYNLGFGDVDLDLHGSANQVCRVAEDSAAGCEYADDTWSVDVDTGGHSVRLPAGGVQKIDVKVTAPKDAKSGEQRAVLLSASKSGSSSVVAEALVRAVVKRDTHLSALPVVDTQSADPGRTLTYTVRVRNTGNAVENLTMEMAQLPAGWTASIVPNRFELADGQERVVQVAVESAPDALANAYDLQVIGRNADEEQTTAAALKAHINQVFDASLATETPVVRILPTDSADVLFEVRNLGNGPDAFTLSGIPTTWAVTLTPDVTPVLQPGESTLVHLQGTLGGKVGSQTVPLMPVSTTSGDAASPDPLPFTLIVSRPDLYVRTVKLLSEARHAGDLEVITAEVENLGGIEAKDVRVTLFVDGEPTGTSLDFERLAPERVLVASLPWSRTVGDHTYRVQVDPDDTIDEGDGEGNNAAVLHSPGAMKSTIHLLGADGRLARASPGLAGPLLMLALLGAAAVVLRRR